MTGYLTGMSGTRVLPRLLQWSFKHTDGDPCDGFSVKCCLEEGLESALEGAAEFYAVHEGRRVFTGFVDDYEISIDKKGLLVEVTGRGRAALLLDSQVRAEEFQLAQLEDILRRYVRPFGVTDLDAEDMGPVKLFVVETGYTCWQVLAGFCRHSANIFPRFSADGRLILRRERPGKTLRVSQGQCVSLRRLKSRYGRIARQLVVNTRTGGIQEAADGEFQAQGGRCVKVVGIVGNKIRANWRTAAQRVEDGRRDRDLVEVTLPGAFLAEPLDRVALTAPAIGAVGTYTVQCAESMGDETGVRCTLTLRK